MSTADTVSDYITQFQGDTKTRLEAIRALIITEVPDAQEGIMYGLVGYKLHGKPLIYFGGFARHIGLYATPSGHEAFSEELLKYKQGKGSVQLPLDQPLPTELIARIVRYRRNTLSGS